MPQGALLALFIAALLAGCEAPTRIVGPARVVDGDSLEIGGTSIRLHAIDAPEGRQTCARDGALWNCGVVVTRRLTALVRGGTIECTQRDIDSYGRTVAVCLNGAMDLGAALVSEGLALAYRQYGRDYVALEDEARVARRGLWEGEFTPPWEWRRNPQAPALPGAAAPAIQEPSEAPAPRATAECQIKGNINRSNERIYHMPGEPSYEATRIDTGRGERWFCSEPEAQRAGWRAPRG